jgi:hypothetical protein
MRNGFELLRVLCIKDTNTCILSDMSQSVYISHKIHVKYVINVICIYSYLSRICVLKGKIKWIEKKLCEIRICSKYPFKMQNNDI